MRVDHLAPMIQRNRTRTRQKQISLLVRVGKKEGKRRSVTDRLRIGNENGSCIILHMLVIVLDVWWFGHGSKSSNKIRKHVPNETFSWWLRAKETRLIR